eukprot:8396422-Ditylum_brightwellii.AAC.1
MNKMFATQLSAIKALLNQIKTDIKSQSGQPKSRILHNSRTYRFPKEGYQVEATRADTMGSSRRNKDWVPGA